MQVQFDGGTLVITGLDPATRDRLAKQIPVAIDPRVGGLRCDAMFAARVIGELSAAGSPIDLDFDRPEMRIPDRRQLRLRDDQRAAAEAFLDQTTGLIQMPTGTGKTVVAIEILIRLSVPTLVVAPVRDLMYQWHDRILGATGVDAGIIGDGVHRVSPISVTTYDSAAIHMARIGDKFDLIVFDEVHHLSGDWRTDAARMSAAAHRLGLSATLPSAADKLQSLQNLVGPIRYAQSIDQAAGRSLAQYTVRRVPVQLNAEEQRSHREHCKTIQQFVADQKEIDPDFQWQDAVAAVNRDDDDLELAVASRAATAAMRAKKKIEDQCEAKFRVLEDLFRLHHGSPVLVFTGSNVMARKISSRFLVPCLLSHCGKRERQCWLAGFATGDYPVLVANRVLDEGIDLPVVKIAIVLGGLSSTRQSTQRLGRILRKTPGDRSAILYEVVTEQTGEVQRSRDRRRTPAYRTGRR